MTAVLIREDGFRRYMEVDGFPLILAVAGHKLKDFFDIKFQHKLKEMGVDENTSGKIYVSMSEASNTEEDSLNTILRHCQGKTRNPRWRYLT